MLDNRKIGELPEITGKMVKVSLWDAALTRIMYMLAYIALTLALNCLWNWIPEHHPCGVSWPTTSVHRAPAAGRLALEQARGSHPWPGWALTLMNPEGSCSEGVVLDLCVRRMLLCSLFFMCINHPVVKDLWVQGLEDSGDIMEKLLCVKNSFDNSLFHIDPLQISPCPSA